MKHGFEFISTRVEGWPSLAGLLAPHDGHTGIEVAGTSTTQVVPGTPMRTESVWSGPLDGTSRFTLISLDDTQTRDAQLSRYRGDLVLSTPRGDLIGQDEGLWDLATGDYVDVYRVTSGTGDYAGVTAVIVLSGRLDPSNGKGASTYQGVVTARD
jgi:hypothetical protein